MTSRQAVAFGQIRSVIAWGIASLLLVTLEACQEKTAYKPPPPPRVTVGTPARQEVTDYLELTGNTQAVNTVQLRARVQGYLEKVFFQDGQVVKKGQPLFQIERDTYVAKLRQAEGQILTQQARLDHAKTEFARFSSLVQQRAAAQTDVDQWRDARDSADGALREAKAARDLAELGFGCSASVRRSWSSPRAPGSVSCSRGRFADGRWVPGSDLDVFVTLSSSDRPVADRVASLLPGSFPVGVDIFPFTRDEIAARAGSPLLDVVARSSWRYARPAGPQRPER